MASSQDQRADLEEEPSENAIQPRKKGNLVDDEMDITPMIDMTFLLLIFFLVASKIDQPADVKLPPAHHGLAVGERGAVIISMRQEGPGKLQVFLGNTTTDTSALAQGDLVQQDEAITAYVESELTSSGEKEYVLIKAARDIKHGDVARVARAAGKAESAQQLYVAVLQSN